MTSETPSATRRAMAMALLAALLGWMFDGFEMGLFPLVARPALKELMGPEAIRNIGTWFSAIMAMFLVGAACGGVLFGWLGDRIGRVRAMVWSVATYAIFSGLCGFAAAPWHLAVLRFIASLGMGGEWALGVALVMEVWPSKSRPMLAGLIGAASNVGFLLIALMGFGLAQVIEELGATLLAIGIPATMVDPLLANSGWRLLLFLGALPAVLTFFIRIFVPESKRWQHAAAGAPKNRIVDIFKGGLARPAILGSLLGAIALLGTWGSVQWIPAWADKLREDELRAETSACAKQLAAAMPTAEDSARMARVADDLARTVPLDQIAPVVTQLAERLGKAAPASEAAGRTAQLATDLAHRVPKAKAVAKSIAQVSSAVGAIIGCILGAYFAQWTSRRWGYFTLSALSLGTCAYLFRMPMSYGTEFLALVLIVGGLTAAFYGWLPLYLPELFPTRIRATGQGFAFNAGRVLAAVGTIGAGQLLNAFKEDYAQMCAVISLVYILGVVFIWFCPETKNRPLPE